MGGPLSLGRSSARSGAPRRVWAIPTWTVSPGGRACSAGKTVHGEGADAGLDGIGAQPAEGRGVPGEGPPEEVGAHRADDVEAVVARVGVRLRVGAPGQRDEGRRAGGGGGGRAAPCDRDRVVSGPVQEEHRHGGVRVLGGEADELAGHDDGGVDPQVGAARGQQAEGRDGAGGVSRHGDVLGVDPAGQVVAGRGAQSQHLREHEGDVRRLVEHVLRHQGAARRGEREPGCRDDEAGRRPGLEQVPVAGGDGVEPVAEDDDRERTGSARGVVQRGRQRPAGRGVRVAPVERGGVRGPGRVHELQDAAGHAVRQGCVVRGPCGRRRARSGRARYDRSGRARREQGGESEQGSRHPPRHAGSPVVVVGLIRADARCGPAVPVVPGAVASPGGGGARRHPIVERRSRIRPTHRSAGGRDGPSRPAVWRTEGRGRFTPAAQAVHRNGPGNGGLPMLQKPLIRPAARRAAVLPLLVTLLTLLGTTVARAGEATGAPGQPVVPTLGWRACGLSDDAAAADVQCAVADLPMDYDDPSGKQVHIAVAKVPAVDQAHRIGSLFFNFGGPGGPSVDYLQSAGAGIFAALNQRFDIVGFDPRGVGQSTPSIDCKANQETQGIYSEPFPTPLDIDVDAYVAKAQSYVDACVANNGDILSHVSTANVARDMDALRAAVGDDRLSYLGFSYGTFLGSTYAALFPDRYRALVLDGPVDAEGYINDPMSDIAEQTAGFEHALSRFFEACAVDQTACSGFGGTSPSMAYDNLVAAADVTPIPADGYAADPRPVTGDDIRTATISLLYAKFLWGDLAAALAEAAAGDASTLRALVDSYYGRNDDGTFDPSTDRYFTIGATEQRYPQGDLSVYLDRGAESWASFPHFWSNSGYAEISYALWPARDEDAFAGPFAVPASSPAPLVIGTTYDPATPYAGALRLVDEMGNARLLTMDGDGHTAYTQSACIDGATNAYLFDGTLPAAGTVCQQETPFVAPEPVPAAALSGVAASSRPTGSPAWVSASRR